MPKTSRRKKCAHAGCKKWSVSGGTCQLHAGPNGVGEPTPEIPAGEQVLKMTDLERLTLVKSETDCVNILLQLRNQELENDEARRRFAKEDQARSAHREQLLAIADARKAEQKRVVTEIAERYKLDPQQMVYDPESGVLRDMRQET
jgi:hypothetical protein